MSGGVATAASAFGRTALSAEAAPWLDALVASWKKHAGPGLFPQHTWESTLALQVLVRPESRFSLPKHPSHLPGLLRIAEAFIAPEDVAACRKLAALSRWAPSPVAPPPADALRRFGFLADNPRQFLKLRVNGSVRLWWKHCLPDGDQSGDGGFSDGSRGRGAYPVSLPRRLLLQSPPAMDFLRLVSGSHTLSPG